MVYTPRAYLVSAAVALVAMQMHQSAATSLYYAPFTSTDTTGTISGKFPARGSVVDDKDCAITVEVDPTLPNITTISTVPVTYPALLANTTKAPDAPVFTKVGKAVVSKEIPSQDANQDGYVGKSSTPVTPPASKMGTTIPSGKGKPKDCATGWDEPAPPRKLRDSAVSGIELTEKLQTKRHLEANTNKDIAKLEAYFGKSMEMNLKNLPTDGVHTPSPWPGPYWPTYQDGINVQWNQGEPSPAEKYATAFGLDVTDFMDKVSKDNGVDSMSKRQKCSSDQDCSNLTDGSLCGIRAGKSSGYCIPGWFGICHAWTPASILEAEPNCPVTHNGVTFQPMDLKGLVSDIYDGASVSTVFTGTRFNGGSDSTDEYGRHTSDAYRDLNPAFFHIAVTNMLGLLNATFVADVEAGSQVWNQPVRGFKVYEQTEMSLEEAAQTFYGLESYPFNAAAKSIVYMKSRLSWVVETYNDGGLVQNGQVDQFTTGAYYTYLLEMDDNGNIIGGEWVYESDNAHPDFIWFPKAKPAADTVTSVGLSYKDGVSTATPTTSTTGSNPGSNDAIPAETPVATYVSTGSSSMTPPPSSSGNHDGNQGSHHQGSRHHGDHHHGDQHQGDRHHGDEHQGDQHQRDDHQHQEGQGQRQWYQSFFHWG
ncbi:Transglutaminase elicitor [Phytophthora megakarya]|uniref:Transglutaminase elicitor n=1 Tax=Phytophthora megakarya TaxID=4795 RepID=A0A225W9A7_9STRA|nr:Transglutaminase elicitor [Phytophthora megakarya]